MRIICTKDYGQVSRKAANIIFAQVTLKPDSVLGLATGSSPVGTYRYLIERYQKGDIDFGRIRTVNLDEYAGMDLNNGNSYAAFMQTNFFEHINVPPENTNIPNGMAADQKEECARYDEVIQALGGIDLQLLGIGSNGHIGFNEPGDVFSERTHHVALAEATIEANKRFFSKKEDVPRFAYTMGIYDIMQAERVIMVACGKQKAEIIKKAFTEPVTPRVPASILQFHRNFTLIADEEALSEIIYEKYS
ncbi:MAG: glucosamine-6-phosphate deaminase [Lachnospiraceae bacterium]|nr:glucosamine-6-phosphate deaminase [Lachnospiraceae bacterium]